MRVAIIGNGPAALSLMAALYRNRTVAENPLRISIFGYPDRLVGPGNAFKNDSSVFLLNTTVENAYVDSSQKDQFYSWLNCKWDTSAINYGEVHVPRSLFGNFLSEQFVSLSEKCSQIGWSVEFQNSFVKKFRVEVRNISSCTTFWVNGGAFDAVVMCLGAGQSSDPYCLRNISGYIGSPYPSSNLDEIDTNSSVFIIGTNLTACDAAVELLDRKHRGKITMGSRRGVLPSVRNASESIVLSELTEENIDRHCDSSGRLTFDVLLGLIGREIAAQDGVLNNEMKIFRGGAHALSYFLHYAHSSCQSKLQAIVQAVDVEIVEKIDSLISDCDKRFLSANAKSALRALQCPLPKSTSQILSRALSSGKLDVVSGVASVIDRNHGFEVSSNRQVAYYTKVIDATRTIAGFEPSGEPVQVLNTILENNMGSMNRNNALNVDFDTNRVTNPLAESIPLYAIGEITRGNVFYSSSLPEVVRGADRVANDLVSRA